MSHPHKHKETNKAKLVSRSGTRGMTPRTDEAIAAPRRDSARDYSASAVREHRPSACAAAAPALPPPKHPTLTICPPYIGLFVIGGFIFEKQEGTLMAPNTTSSKKVGIKRPDALSVKHQNDAAASSSSPETSSPRSPRAPSLPARELNMKSEADRYKTFDTWPVHFMDKTLMAAAGFFYLNRSDTVQCAFCSVQIGRWEEGDDPFKDHKRWCPSCPYLRKLNVGNIPRGNTPAIYPDGSVSCDTCGPFRMELRPNSAPERKSHEQKQSLFEQFGITEARGPIYANFCSEEARVKSFETWPKSLKQRPGILSMAGFFYSGRGDQTYCFYCGGGLKDWQDSDDPWVEHAKWFPKCVFVILNKGKEFIEKVSQSKEAVVKAEAVKDITTPRQQIVNQPSANVPSSKCSEQVSESYEKNTEEKKSTKSIDESRLCKICYEEELGVLFLPCGHLVACVKCAPVLSKCAVCRKPFTGFVNAFIP